MSNTLRGGKKLYGGRTLIANFVEDGAAEGRDISSAQFQTTSMKMNFDTSAQPGRFGAGLYYEKPDLSQNPTKGTYTSPDFYTSVTKSVHADPRSNDHTQDFKSDFKLTGGLKTEEELSQYIEQWTQENATTKQRRFRTTMNGVQIGKPGGKHGETKQLSLQVKK
mmetsp:Transcript_13766/g.16386  ORF Transcript_13766/g.16386 Transcript_13766/m.16386 type:complete len:165 (+) Transcript_13766:63-557(+)